MDSRIGVHTWTDGDGDLLIVGLSRLTSIVFLQRTSGNVDDYDEAAQSQPPWNVT